MVKQAQIDESKVRYAVLGCWMSGQMAVWKAAEQRLTFCLCGEKTSEVSTEKYCCTWTYFSDPLLLIGTRPLTQISLFSSFPKAGGRPRREIQDECFLVFTENFIYDRLLALHFFI